MKSQVFNITINVAKCEKYDGYETISFELFDRRTFRVAISADNLPALVADARTQAVLFARATELREGENMIQARVSVRKGERKPRGFDAAVRSLDFAIADLLA